MRKSRGRDPNGAGSGRCSVMSAQLRSAVPVISKRENSIAGTCWAGLGRYPMSTWEKMMTNELRIAAMVLGLSTSSALAQDVAAGETSFRKCLPCHAVGTGGDARNKIGPLLNSINGRKWGAVVGYSYSEANKNSAFSWNEAIFLTTSRTRSPQFPACRHQGCDRGEQPVGLS
jgi:cytochrome c2